MEFFRPLESYEVIPAPSHRKSKKSSDPHYLSSAGGTESLNGNNKEEGETPKVKSSKEKDRDKEKSSKHKDKKKKSKKSKDKEKEKSSKKVKSSGIEEVMEVDLMS
jgi:hypothetical protein